jgi:hypothetical protein
MEQYHIPIELEFENFRFCLDNYTPNHLFIKECETGQIKVDEDLEGKTLDFKKDEKGLHILINDNEVFNFPENNYGMSFSLRYVRMRQSEDGSGPHLYERGNNPYHHSLPEPKLSVLTHYFDEHLFELSFPGRIDLKFHSKDSFAFSNYWTICKPKKHR